MADRKRWLVNSLYVSRFYGTKIELSLAPVHRGRESETTRDAIEMSEQQKAKSEQRFSNGRLAEWLGRGLQNLVQQFESATDLNGLTASYPGIAPGVFYSPLLSENKLILRGSGNIKVC